MYLSSLLYTDRFTVSSRSRTTQQNPKKKGQSNSKALTLKFAKSIYVPHSANNVEHNVCVCS